MLTCFVRTVILYLSIVISMRIMGKRQIGQMEMSELVTTILISEVAAVPMQDLGIPLIYGLIPLVTLLALEFLQSSLCARFLRLRGIFYGHPSVLIRDGVPDQRQLAAMRISVSELMEELRLKDVFDLSTVAYAILETNGRMSVLLRPSDSQAAPEPRIRPLIMQGMLIRENMKAGNHSRRWLNAILRDHGLKGIGEVYLMTIDDKGNIVLHPREAEKRGDDR